MQQYILRRVLMLFPVLLGVSFTVFVLLRLLPGDVVTIMRGETGNLTDEQAEALRTELGLNKPFILQYGEWVWGILRGDWGVSVWSRRPVLDEMLRRLPVSAELALLALIISLSLAIPIGVIAAVRQDTPLDYLVRVVSVFGLSVPGFWLATMAILFTAIQFQWVPPLKYTAFVDNPWLNLQSFLLPAFAIGIQSSASVMRMTRTTLLEVLRQDYVRTAWAKGLTERAVIVRHGLKNAMIPVVTIVGNQVGFLLGGSVIMEQIFTLPGLGRLTLESIYQRDYPQLQGNILFIATVFVTVNLIVDISYAWLDPRIRFR
ncbi:MAG: ABC transporter permease [Chloroflexi bacterium]|nr:ABC transporter permease [Chloroflexota bacterium]